MPADLESSAAIAVGLYGRAFDVSCKKDTTTVAKVRKP